MPSNMAAEEEEDDYLSMTFDSPSTKPKESSLQRTARLKKESMERGRIPSKAERITKEKLDRETALATSINESNKGAKMMAKMGFKAGSALGATGEGRKQPIELMMKDDRGGIGMDSEKRKRVREAAEQAQEGEKRRKVGMEEFRERNRSEREERRAEGMWWGAMKVLDRMEEDASKDGTDADEVKESREGTKKSKGLHDVNVLYRPLIKQRLERDRDRKMRYELNNSLSTRNDNDDDSDSDAADQKDPSFSGMIAELDDEDEELQEYEALGFAERLDRVVRDLRQKHRYCFWCKYQYPDAEMEGCPGLTEDEHG